MSVQKRIDEFFKCSSSNKNTKWNGKSSKKTTNRLKFSRNNGTGNGGKSPAAGKKNDWRCNNAVDASWRAAVEAGLANSAKFSATTQSYNNNPSTSLEAPEIEIINGGNVTPNKLTIKSFFNKCNTPPKNPSPGKISLKRRNNNISGSHSPPKITLISKDSVNDSLPEIIEIPVSISGNSRPKSATEVNDVPDDFDPDIVELNITNIHDTSVEKSDHSVSPENQKFAIAEVRIEDAESMNQKKNNSKDDRSASSSTERKIPPKIGNSVTSRTKSPWKVVTTIKTPDRAMTELSSNWQKTLEVPKNSSKPPRIEKTKNHRENFVTPTQSSKTNDGNSSLEKLPKSAMNTTECSPRRALFLPPNTPKKVRFEGHSNIANLSSSNGMEGVASLTNGNDWSSDQIDIESNSAKLIYSPNSPKKINGISISPPQKENRLIGSLESPKKIAESFDSPIKSEISEASSSSGPSNILTLPAKSIGSPMTPTRTSRSSFSPRVKCSPQKARRDSVDMGIVMRVVENLNDAKQGVLIPNDFDLETIYAKKSFDLEYGIPNTGTAIKFEAKDVREPETNISNDFFTVLVNVFSEPMNCGYFNETELFTIFSMMTQSPKAQSLFWRILKRVHGWHRIGGIQYTELGTDLTPLFTELVTHGFFEADVENEEIFALLKVLSSSELTTICKAMKVKHEGSIDERIANLMKLSSKKSSLFPGCKSPSAALKEKVITTLGRCVRVPQRIKNLADRIFILLFPCLDLKENIIEKAAYILSQVRKNRKVFPPAPKEQFPIFRNRSHLIRYVEAKAVLHQILKAIEKGKWDKVRELGMLAYDQLKPYFESNNSEDEDDTSPLPSHVKHFDDNYVWIKILSSSIDAFKRKENKDIDTAVMFLETLISPKNKISRNKIDWYEKLALIEIAHRKNLEKSADITIEALSREELSELDAATMIARARILLNRSKGISAKTKELLNTVVEKTQKKCISTSEPVVKEITARKFKGKNSSTKSLWTVETNSDVYMTVEEVALLHYRRNGFTAGVHCEGNLPITLFAVLFWSQIYEMSVPGGFISSYQHIPLDLYSSSFHKSRRDNIDNQMKVIRNWGFEYLSQSMHEDLVKYLRYESLIPKTFAENPDNFKGCIECLGMDAVVGICERLVGNFYQWKAGFPDLILWNTATKKCKVVEVKGPGDTLSTKQKVWIQFLETLGVDVEVCHVKDTKKYAA